jgi:pimeloyl-ACP methyl ester carboxylesterase
VRKLVAGQLDLLMPPCTQAALATTLGGIPYELISGGGHSIWIEQPAAVADSLRGALAAD